MIFTARHLPLYLLLLLLAGCAGMAQREPTSAGWKAHSQSLASLQKLDSQRQTGRAHR